MIPQEWVDKYQTILKFTSAKTLDISLIDSLLEFSGYQVAEPIKRGVINVVEGLTKEKGYTNLFQVAKDPDFLSTVVALKQDFEALNIDPSTFVHKKGSQPAIANKQIHQSPQGDLLPIDSVVCCAHCRKPFALGDAYGLKEKMAKSS